MMPELLVVDDDAEFRRSLVWLLESLGHRSMAFASGEAFLAHWERHAERYRCPVLLLDVRLDGLSGLQVHHCLLESPVQPAIIYITGCGNVPMAVEAMSLGAVTVIEKPLGECTLQTAIQRAVEARADPSRVSSLPPPDRELARRLALLTPRERDVLDRVVDGLLSKQIAEELGISIKTVELHRSRVLQKLNAASTAALIRMIVSGMAEWR